MDDKRLSELDKLFNNTMERKEFQEYSQALVEYLLFVKETSPFNTISRKIQKSWEISRLYKEIEKEIEKNYGMVSKVLPYTFCDIQRSRCSLRTFHNKIIKKAEEQGLRKKDEIILSSILGEDKIYLVSDNSCCYSLKRTGSQRFRIILILYRNSKGKSAKGIADFLPNKNGFIVKDQARVKIEIKKINKIFQKEIKTENELIVTNKNSKKNFYFLNRECFIFKREG